MWLKENRFLLVSKIYQILFWKDYDSNILQEDISELPIIEDFIYPEGWTEFVSTKVSKLQELDSDFQSFLELKLRTSSKTFLLVKAILAAAFVEFNELGLEQTTELKLANVYSKLTQDLVGGQSPELVFSILNGLEKI